MEEYGPTKNDVKSIIKWVLLGVLILVIVLFIAGIVSYAFGWLNAPLRLTNPNRLEKISREANEAWQALESQKANVSNIRDDMLTMKQLYGEDMSKWPQGKDDEYLQLQQQQINMINAYNSQCAAYRAKWKNEWWEISAPKDLPTTCDLIE
jgi:hypothetical protein